jgi:hypothetical protein
VLSWFERTTPLHCSSEIYAPNTCEFSQLSLRTTILNRNGEEIVKLLAKLASLFGEFLSAFGKDLDCLAKLRVDLLVLPSRTHGNIPVQVK